MNLKKRLRSTSVKDVLADQIRRSIFEQRAIFHKIGVVIILLLVIYLSLAVFPFHFSVSESKPLLIFEKRTSVEESENFSHTEITKEMRKDMISQEKESLNLKKIPVNCPLSVSGLLLWPDNVESRALCSVVQTLNGYRIYDFNGWVKFSDLKDSRAYRYENGRHYPLKYREQENAYYVDGSYEVRVKSSEMPTVYRLRVWDRSYYIEDAIGKFLDAILFPLEHSILSCEKIATEDTMNRDRTVAINKIAKLVFDKSDQSRFAVRPNRLSDLATMYSSIQNGYTVGLSLYNEKEECRLAAYGYDKDGNLYLADAATGTPVMTGKIVPCSQKIPSGEMETWFIIEGYEDYNVVMFAQNLPQQTDP